MRRALIVHGGWEGHQPGAVATLLARWLREIGIEVILRDSLDAFIQEDLHALDLIVPVWTMGEISADQCRAVSEAVAGGTGLAGCHGGMCDAFRMNTEWQFLTGGQFVAHPGGEGVQYTVNVGASGGHPSHPITDGMDDFTIETEQYYMHVDPANTVLASTIVPPPAAQPHADEAKDREIHGPHTQNPPVRMPVVWTRRWGRGCVFYNALGHTSEVLETPPVRHITARGMLWATRRG